MAAQIKTWQPTKARALLYSPDQLWENNFSLPLDSHVAPKKDKTLSGNMLHTALPKTIGASERSRQNVTMSLTGSNHNLGFPILWSSIFLVDIAIILGRNPARVPFRTDCVSSSMIKSTMAKSCPALCVEKATHTSPRGKVGIFTLSVLTEMRSTFTV